MIIHFSPKRGARYLRKTRKMFRLDFYSNENLGYINHYDSEQYVKELKSRSDSLDIVIITAHGSKSSIIEPLRQIERGKNNSLWTKVITAEDSQLFIRKFVAALSCLTANVLGNEAVESGAIAYLGFNEEISKTLRIEHVKNDESYEKYSKKILSLSRKIVVKSFYDAIKNFIMNCYTAKRLKEDFSYNIEENIAELYQMNRKSINEKYGIYFKVKEELFLKDTLITMGSKAKRLIESIELLGEKYYIPFYFLDKLDEDKLFKILKDNKRYSSSKTIYYKYLVDSICYKLLGNEDEFDSSISKLNHELSIHNISLDYEPILSDVSKIGD